MRGMSTRRDVLHDALRVASLMAMAGMLPGVSRAQAAQYAQEAFDAKAVPEALKALGLATPTESKDVTLTGPEIAENGAVVPLVVSSTLPNARRLLLLVEKNPAVLSVVFELGEGVEPSVSSRVKMAQTSNVYAVAVTTEGRVFFAQKEVKITLGGCGG